MRSLRFTVSSRYHPKEVKGLFVPPIPSPPNLIRQNVFILKTNWMHARKGKNDKCLLLCNELSSNEEKRVVKRFRQKLLVRIQRKLWRRNLIFRREKYVTVGVIVFKDAIQKYLTFFSPLASFSHFVLLDSFFLVGGSPVEGKLSGIASITALQRPHYFDQGKDRDAAGRYCASGLYSSLGSKIRFILITLYKKTPDFF